MTTLTPVCTAAEFRAGFPMLTRVVHLASCSIGARSAALDTALGRMLSDTDAETSKRVMNAMLQLDKLDLKALQKAYDGE